MLGELPSIYLDGVLVESVVSVTMDDGASWRLLKLIRIGSPPDDEAGEDFASPFA